MNTPDVAAAVERMKGFTLTGLLVAVAMISLLAGIVIPEISSRNDDARRAQAWSDMEILAKAFVNFRTDTKAWPSNGLPTPAVALTTADHDLVAYRCFFANTSALPGWKGPYLEPGVVQGGKMQVAMAATATQAGGGFLDPWGQPYRVFTFAPGPGSSGAVMIVSRGPDGVVNSSSMDVHSGVPSGDDLVKLVLSPS